jgi:tRNA-uridine 2-sulfurtransferase
MIRAHAEPVAARVRSLEGERLEVRFDEPQTAVAPGQAVVLHEGERVLGGGWIERATGGREEMAE